MSSDTGLYFAQFPKNFDKLKAVLVAVRGVAVGMESWPGPRQFYREIIFTEPDLLIAPESEDNVVSEKAVIIAENHMLESGKLCCTLQKFSLEQKASIPLTRSLFLYCLQFVLTHRLAPLWNKIDKYFIQGRDFLAEENKICAVQADFSLTDKITLALKAQLVKLPKPKVEDFGVSPNILQKFHQSHDFSIHGYSVENNKCFVLPSLKTGYITCISHRDMEGIDFKRYWKVMYGFRLPVNDPEREVFYSIRFPMSGKIFSYPEYCIRHKEPQVSVRCDQKAIFKSFLEDLTLRMPSVCGAPLTLTSSTLYPTNNLHLASVSKQTNLTRAPTLSKANQPFAFTKKIKDNGNALNKDTRPNGSTSIKISNSIENSYQGSNSISRLNMHIPQSRYARVTPNTNSLQNTHQDSVNVPPPKTPIAQRYVPIFTKRKSVEELSKKKILPKDGKRRKEKPLVPCFKKSVSKSKASTINPKMPASSGLAEVVGRDVSKIVKPSSSNVGNVVGDDGPRAVSSSDKGMLISRERLSLSLSKKHGGDSNGVTQQPELRESFDILNEPGVVITLSGPSQLTGGREAALSPQSMDSHVMSEGNSRSLVEENQFVQKQSAVSKKKKAKEPIPDVLVDVRKMVAEKKLSKVSAAAIIKWLKSEGVKCKCKEKKQEVMLKVYQHLGLVRPER